MPTETIDRALVRFTTPIRLTVEKLFNLLGWFLLTARVSAARLSGDLSLKIASIAALLALLAYIITIVLTLLIPIKRLFKPGQSNVLAWIIIIGSTMVIAVSSWCLSRAWAKLWKPSSSTTDCFRRFRLPCGTCRKLSTSSRQQSSACAMKKRFMCKESRQTIYRRRMVEPSGIEPLTSCMPCKRSPS